MKTLREYIDQLDEIDRRGFLKGMGAAAGLTAMGGTKANDLQSRKPMVHEIPIVEQMCKLYWLSKRMDPPSPQILKMIQTYIKKNPNKKDFVGATYRRVADELDALELKDYQRFTDEIDYLMKNKNKIIDKFEDLSVFGELNSPSDTQLASWKDQARTAMMREEELEEGIKSKLAGAALAGALAMNPAQADTVDKYTPLNQMKADTAYKIAIAKKRGAAGLPLNMPDVTGPITKETPFSHMKILDAYNMARAEAGIKPIYPIDKIKEEDLEEASPDAVQRIEQLVKYK